MITLLTGAPGAGKSSAVVMMLQEWGAKGRPIYVDGIPDLKIPHVEIQGQTWPDSVPDGAIVCIDEVQRVWRPTGPGQRVSRDIAELETHRHRGLDFLIVTQHPKLVHTNVRALVGRHIHLRDVGILGRWWYEWPEAADPGTWRSAPLKRRYRLARASFGLYKSASEHVKPVRSFPKVLVVLAAAVVGVGVLAWQAISAVQDRMAGGSVPVVQGVGSGAQSQASPSQASGGLTASEIVDSFRPRIAARPDTAPAYDALRVVVVMPRIVGGYCQGERCYCQTQQGTAAGIPDVDCRAWIKSPPFDPYSLPRAAPAAPVAPAESQASKVLADVLPSAPT